LRVAFHEVVVGGNNTAFLIPTNLYMNTLMYFLCSNVLFTRMSFRVQAISYIYIGKVVSNLWKVSFGTFTCSAVPFA